MADVLVSGATSMVGSWFAANTPRSIAVGGRRDPQLDGGRAERFDFVDITVPETLSHCVERSPEPALVNFAARTDVDGVERERPASGASGGGPAWTVNIESVRSIARAVARTDRFLIQISTDFVFDGRAGPYTETAARSPLSEDVSWYGWTKSEAERWIEGSGARAAIVRIAYPYGPRIPAKADLPHWILDTWRAHRLPSLYTDQWLSPTWIPDASMLIDRLLLEPKTGVFHLASPTLTTPFEFGTTVLESFAETGTGIVRGCSIFDSVAPGRAPRPVRGGLSSKRLEKLGVVPTPWQDGVRKLAEEERGRL